MSVRTSLSGERKCLLSLSARTLSKIALRKLVSLFCRLCLSLSLDPDPLYRCAAVQPAADTPGRSRREGTRPPPGHCALSRPRYTTPALAADKDKDKDKDKDTLNV